jgi:hypothetical protein
VRADFYYRASGTPPRWIWVDRGTLILIAVVYVEALTALGTKLNATLTSIAGKL